jgi:hypothetical protein
VIDDHAPEPGPFFWDWRCRRCEHPVTAHASRLRRLWRRLTTPQPHDLDTRTEILSW